MPLKTTINENFKCGRQRFYKRDFGEASGQLINLSKSGIFFSPKIDPNVITSIQQILNVNLIPITDRYLGAPLLTNTSKIKSFEPLVVTMKKRLKGWKGELLNYAGRTVMIRNVASSTCVYQMN